MAFTDVRTAGFEPRFGFKNSPDKRRRITPVDGDGVKIILFQVLVEPGQTALLVHGGALVNSPAIGNHHRCHQPAILGAPPATGPVATALFFKSTVT